MYLLISKVFTIGKNYYPQVLLKKCKYVIKEKKFKNIFDDIEIFSDSDYEKVLIIRKILMKKFWKKIRQ